jgi:uncharacterized protein (DUF2147 family)
MVHGRVGAFAVAALSVAAIGIPAGPAFAQAPAASRIVGTWLAEDGTKFEMFDAGGSYAARTIYAPQLVEADKKTFKKDTQNPDPQLRNRSLQGIVFIKDLTWNASNHRWDGGEFYAAAAGRTLSARVELVNDVMQLRVYRGTPMLGRTITLRRVAS